jgi:hypothetical protein
MFSLHFVRSGRAEPHAARDIAAAHRLRAAATYDPSYDIGREIAVDSVARAETLVAHMKTLVRGSAV